MQTSILKALLPTSPQKFEEAILVASEAPLGDMNISLITSMYWPVVSLLCRPFPPPPMYGWLSYIPIYSGGTQGSSRGHERAPYHLRILTYNVPWGGAHKHIQVNDTPYGPPC